MTQNNSDVRICGYVCIHIRNIQIVIHLDFIIFDAQTIMSDE